jgi:glycine/D-amino acid oxidase-like deaminating enzyme
MLYDFIIVGQGIAGSVLSYTLLRQNQKVLVINHSQGHCSSLVAGGIFNPITGKNLVKTWQADHLFPFMLHFYQELEQVLATHFLHQVEIYRPFRSLQEQNDWLAKSASAAFKDYLKETEDSYFQEDIFNTFGGIATLQAGWVDLPTFLTAYKQFLIEKEAYREELFENEAIEFQTEKVLYKDIAARYLIFCTGVSATTDSLWSFLPFSPVKGETIDICIPDASFEKIVNQGVSIVPLGKQIYRVASTYSWQNLDWHISQEAKQELMSKANTILKKPFEVIGQKAGIRPATKHRRPIMGLHPTQARLGIFNGLGSKGVSLAPFWANHFASHLLNHTPLHKEVVQANAYS